RVVTGVQTCALPICVFHSMVIRLIEQLSTPIMRSVLDSNLLTSRQHHASFESSCQADSRFADQSAGVDLRYSVWIAKARSQNHQIGRASCRERSVMT